MDPNGFPTVAMLCDMGCEDGGYDDYIYNTDELTFAECICQGAGTQIDMMKELCDEVCNVICDLCNPGSTHSNPCPKAPDGQENDSVRCYCESKCNCFLKITKHFLKKTSNL